MRSFGSEGSGQGEFNGPRGVAVDDDGNVLVADTMNNRIQKFTADGKFITAVGRKGKKELEFDYPTGIAIHPTSKRIYVSESLNKRVQILNPDLTSHSTFNVKTSKGGLRGIAFDKSARNVYIGKESLAETSIQVSTEKGDHLRWLGYDELKGPHDVSIDSNDTVYVCDTYNYRICIFDCKGHFLQSFGSKGRQLGQFNCPKGLAVDENGLIYVSDSDNDRVQIFELYIVSGTGV